MTAERDALRALGDIAGEHGVRIAVENIDPVGIYLARRAYGPRLDVLGEQIARVDHPQVGICFDAGHAYLASVYDGFDYLGAIRGIAGKVVHIHLSDNLGRVQLDGDVDQMESLALGDGDLHLVPGWGAVPLRDVFRIPFPHRPIVVLEMRPHFAEHAAEALATMRELAAMQDALEPVGAALP